MMVSSSTATVGMAVVSVVHESLAFMPVIFFQLSALALAAA